MTRLELRRLAFRATRNPKEWLPVLQDALLEHYGEKFERAMIRAREIASESLPGTFVVVVYDPAPLPFGRSRSPGPDFSVASYIRPEDLDHAQPTSRVRQFAEEGRVIVFLAPAPAQPKVRR